jgi:hypothetical protein
LCVLELARPDGDRGDPAFRRRLDIIGRVADDDDLRGINPRQFLERGREDIGRGLGLLDVVAARRRGDEVARVQQADIVVEFSARGR